MWPYVYVLGDDYKGNLHILCRCSVPTKISCIPHSYLCQFLNLGEDNKNLNNFSYRGTRPRPDCFN